MWRSAVLPLVLVLSMSWATLHSFGRGEPVTTGGAPPLAVAAVVPQSITPVVPEARLFGKPSPAALILFVATLLALLLGICSPGRRSAAGRTGSARTPSALLHAVRGRAPPRRSA